LTISRPPPPEASGADDARTLRQGCDLVFEPYDMRTPGKYAALHSGTDRPSSRLGEAWCRRAAPHRSASGTHRGTTWRGGQRCSCVDGRCRRNPLASASVLVCTPASHPAGAPVHGLLLRPRVMPAKAGIQGPSATRQAHLTAGVQARYAGDGRPGYPAAASKARVA
jgi:hypothetical protein